MPSEPNESPDRPEANDDDAPSIEPSDQPADSSSDSVEDKTSATRFDPANRPKEYGGRKGPDPVRYGDWEKNGRCIDF